jgi:hypothetical protein
MKPICSPYSLKKSSDFSCFTYENLLLLKHYWNIRHPNNIIETNDYYEIWEELNYYMKIYLCESEKCWLRKLVNDLDIKHDIFSESFVPNMPKEWKNKPRTWLSDLDISKVMKQYELAYNNFIFIGPSPIDYHNFDDTHQKWVWPELKFFSLDKYLKSQYKQHKYIGIVFNLDKHTGTGTHWVALFINLEENKIYYFDSNGNNIPSNIKKLTETIKTQGKKYNKKFSLSVNYPNTHQKKNTECGIYVLYFIVNMLTKNNWKHFKNEKISDDEIFKYRKIFFNH